MDRFETQNLYQASWCLYTGLKLIGTKQDGRKVTLIFQGKDAAEQAYEFFNGAKGEAQSLFNSYRTLKDAVFQR